MNFNIKTKDDEGNITGEFRFNEVEMSYIATVGLSYLAQKGALKIKEAGIEDEPDGDGLGIHEAPDQVQ